MATPEQAAAFKKMAGLKPSPEQKAPEEDEDASPEEANVQGEDAIEAAPMDENTARQKYQAAVEVLRKIASQFPIDQKTLVPAYETYEAAAQGMMPFLSPQMQAGLTTLLGKYKSLIKVTDDDILAKAGSEPGSVEEDIEQGAPEDEMVPSLEDLEKPVGGIAKPVGVAPKAPPMLPKATPPAPLGDEGEPKKGGFPPKKGGGFPPKKGGGFGGGGFKKKFGGFGK